MDNEKQNELIDYIKSINPKAEGVFIHPNELIFEENVKMNCFYCGKYGNNWRCPPNLPNIDYVKMMSEFTEGLFVVLAYDVKTEEEYQLYRNESSVSVHKLLIELERYMWNHNNSTAVSFIGGSCKLCKNGCGKDKCNNPYMSRSPIEALGINVVKSAKKYGIDIRFPTEKHFKRIGLLLWENEEE